MSRFLIAIGLAAGLLLAACRTPAPQVPLAAAPARKAVVSLVLGGGAARGFAHVGVIKMLESQGLEPDLVVGTSAGAVAGSLYAAGKNGFELQELSFDLERAVFADWQFFGHGVLRGEKLQNFIDDKVAHRPIEQLPRRFAAVAVKIRTGQVRVFTSGDVGMAVRASAAIPGVFQAPVIDGAEYVDGGTVSPVPVRIARSLGADVVVAVDVSQPIEDQSSDGTLRALLKTYTIMGHALAASELPLADVVIAPDVSGIGAADFDDRQRAILAGERAALAAMPRIRTAIAAANASLDTGQPAPRVH